jgi:hypothetical protein
VLNCRKTTGWNFRFQLVKKGKARFNKNQPKPYETGACPSMLEFDMHEAQVLRQEGLKVREIAKPLGKGEGPIYRYMGSILQARKKRI